MNKEHCEPVVKKRGRKSKKELEEIALQKACKDNINVFIEELNDETKININTINDMLNLDNETEPEKNVESNLSQLSKDNDDKPVAKKRGRKPKGGKIIQQIVSLNNNKDPKPNVILHLKCSLKDLQSNLVQGYEIQSFNFQPTNQLTYNIINSESNNFNKQEQAKNVYDDIDDDDDISVKENDAKEVCKKLKVLEHNLHINNISDKKSACFWCTYDYDNPCCYIPKYEMDNEVCGYGSFCRPECAVGYLMKENLDDSTKFERYHLLNRIYGKVYNFKNNIKPAPNPYYLLDKFYGNLSIQEYRKLLNNDHMLMVIDKPLTRILPELHEDTDDFVAGVYGGSKGNATQAGGVYKVKRQSEKPKGVSKTTIMREQFGIAA